MLLLSHYFEPENGAPQRRWRALIDRFVERGVEVDVVAPAPHYPSGRLIAAHRAGSSPGQTETGPKGDRVHRVSFIRHDGSILRRTLDHVWVSLVSARRVGSLMRDEAHRPDVVVVTAPALPTIVAGRWIAKRHRVPLIIEMRDAWPDLVSHTPGLRGGRSLKSSVKDSLHTAITSLQKAADVVVTTTQSFAEVLRRRGVKDTVVIRNGTDPERYEAIGRAGADHDNLRVLYMGTIGRSQGLEAIVHAAARLSAEQIPIEVRVVGAGADHARLRSLNGQLGNPIDLRPAVLPEEVMDHYRWADTCVVSLRDWEPFKWTVPSKLYELMATGKHLTAMLAGEAAAIVEETQCGLLVEPGDVDGLVAGWRTLAADRSQLEIGDGGRGWVRANVTYDRLAELYLELFDRLAGTQQRVAR
nr:glycosyltransferase family 4 protein [Agrococcus sp. ARC_14]